MRRARTVLAIALVSAGLAPAAAAAAAPPYKDPRLPVAQRVDDLLGRMTLAEKIGQMTQTERYQVFDDAQPITSWKLGSILSGSGSTPAARDRLGPAQAGPASAACYFREL